MGCGHDIATVRLPKTQETNHLYIIISGTVTAAEWREAIVYVGLSHTVPLLLPPCVPQCVQPVTQTSEKQLGNIQVPEVR